MLPLRSDQSSDELIDSATTLREDLDPGTAAAGVTPYLIGQPTIWAGMQEISKQDLSKAEGSGFPIVALILLVVFGSLAAAALPLALGFVSVLVTGALIYFISLQMTTSVFVTNMASMIGIGVAVDYSLFILARYREEREAGRNKCEARAQALSTSGLAVTFSGLAVIISLAGLWMVDNQALRSMALGAMTVVAVSILTATTLLPALIAMLGDRVLPGGIVGRVERFLKHRVLRRPERAAAVAETAGASRFWEGWTRRVMARPWTAVIAVSAVLLTLAIPVLSLETGTQALSQFPRGSDVRVGNELASKQLGGGTDPMQIVAAFPAAPTAADRAAVAGFVRRLEATPGIAAVAPPAFAGESVLIQATPSAPSESDAALALVDRLRDSVVPGTALSRVATVDVGGETARSHDVRAQISGSMWKIVLFVLALSFIVLMVMLRSLLLAAEGGADEPALDRRRLRRPRRDLPVGLARRLARLRKPGGAGHDQRAADLRRRLRPLDGLRGLPDVADPRALRAPRRQRAGGRRGPLLERPHDLLGGADHDRGLRGLRPHRRALDQGARPRLRGRDRARRDPGAADPGAGGDEAAGRLELVDAVLARPRSPRPQLRGGPPPSRPKLESSI